MRGRIRRSATVVVTVALAALLAIPGAALAAGPGSGGGRGGGAGGGQGNGGGGTPGGGGGGGGEETLSNNLSVPAIFVGTTNPFGLACDVAAVDPTGTPLTGYAVAGYYYVQGIHKWQAQCTTAPSASAAAAWGDNLTGDAKLKVGSPIRVEIGLDAYDKVTLTPQLTGYTVVKLEPDELDRVSPYGTLASGSGTEAAPFAPIPVTPYEEVRVWTPNAHLTVTPVGGTAIVDETATAEINATGRVVYGYNLRVTAPGQYVITYFFPGVTVTGTDAGSYVVSTEGSTVSLTITVTGGGGGGGRR